MAQSEASSVLDKRFIECAICLQPFSDPRLLPCAHTFCSECLQAIAFRSTDDTIPCPTCRQVCQIPVGGARKFQCNSFADMCLRLTEGLPGDEKGADNDDNDDNSTKMCVNWDEEDKHKTAKFFCRDCADYFCHLCTEMHHRQRSFRAHDVVPIEEITQDEIGELVTPESVRGTKRCQTHNLDITLYCDTCCQPVCPTCSIRDHKTHTYRELSTVSIDLQGQLQEAAVPLKDALSRYELLQSKLQKNAAHVQETFSHNRQLLDKAQKAMIHKLQTEADKVRGKLDSHEQALLTTLNATKAQVSSLQSTGNGLQGEIQKLLTEAQHQDFNVGVEGQRLLAEIDKLNQTVSKLPDVLIDLKRTSLPSDVFIQHAGQIDSKESSSPSPLEGFGIGLKLQHIIPTSGSMSSIDSINDSVYMMSGPQQHVLSLAFQVYGRNRGGVTGNNNVSVSGAVKGEVCVCTAGGVHVIAYSTDGHKASRVEHWGPQNDRSTFLFDIRGKITGLSSDLQEKLVVTTVNPAQILIVWLGANQSFQRGLQQCKTEQTIPLKVSDVRKAVSCGEGFAVLAGSSKISWVDSSGKHRHTVGHDAERLDIVDIAPLSSQYLLVSDRTNGVFIFDANGSKLSNILGSQQGVNQAGLIHWDRSRQELMVDCQPPKVTCSRQQGVNQAGPLHRQPPQATHGRRNILVFKATVGVPDGNIPYTECSYLKINLELTGLG